MRTPSLPALDHATHDLPAARPVLLLLAYECMPNRTGEAFVGWGRLLQAAREFEVHALVGAESYTAIQFYLKSQTLPSAIHIHTPPADRLYRLLQRIPLAGPWLAYRRWQRLAFAHARHLHRKHCFSLVHQVNVCSFHEPGYTMDLGVPYLWGPVGGTQNFPAAFLDGLPALQRLQECVHTVANRLALRTSRVRAAGRRAATLFAANSTNQRDFERVFERPVELLLQTGVYSARSADPARFRAAGALHLLWSGEFTTRKALPLLLEALARIDPAIEIHLRILGRGPLEAAWKTLAEKLGIAHRCSFLGHLPLNEAVAQLDWAHLFVFTSLRDTAGNVVLEALGSGVPVLCFDHQGAGDIVTSACGIKIPVLHPDHAIAAIASTLRGLAQDRTPLLALSVGATERARGLLWAENGARVNAVYRSLVLAARHAS